MINKFINEHFFLSNFYSFQSRITAEHYFQAVKTLDKAESEAIMLANSPQEAKRLGRKSALVPGWEKIKNEVMLSVIRSKFANPQLKRMLLNTGTEELIEGNWWHDNEWGDCYCQTCANIPGKNMLGEILMQVREELRKID